MSLQSRLRVARLSLVVVALGLFISGVTVWPAVPELKFAVSWAWGDGPPADGAVLHPFVLKAIEGLESMDTRYPFMLYAHDWLAFAHVMLAVLFAGAARDPVRNRWIIECGLLMCAAIPILAGVCIPIREIPWIWFWIDTAFAPAAAVPLWLALRQVRALERAHSI